MQNLAKYFGITENVTSPTFVIQKRYSITQKKVPDPFLFKKLIHIDAYRLTSSEELKSLDWDDLAKDPENIICIEWPENVKDLIPDDALKLKFDILDNGDREVVLF